MINLTTKRMSIKRIMLCLDGSKHSARGINTAISFAKQTDSIIVGVHSVTKFGLFTAVHLPTIPEGKWPKDARKIIQTAKKKVEKNGIKFEGTVIAGNTAGYDLATFANNPKNKIDHVVIGSRGFGFPKELFLGSTSNFILHKAHPSVTIVK